MVSMSNVENCCFVTFSTFCAPTTAAGGHKLTNQGPETLILPENGVLSPPESGRMPQCQLLPTVLGIDDPLEKKGHSVFYSKFHIIYQTESIHNEGF